MARNPYSLAKSESALPVHSIPSARYRQRHVSVKAVSPGLDGLLDVLAHPNPAKYPKQRVLVVAHDDYAHLVPFVEDKDYFFLKTIIPSRKATRDHLSLGDENAEH